MVEVKEVFNSEAKFQAGPNQKKISVYEERFFTNSVHKECSFSGKIKFLNHVNSLRFKLTEYDINSFRERPVEVLATRQELNKSLIQDLISSPSVGKQKFIEFERIVSSSLFSPI